ncbi:MAG: FHA domain-containing protein [Phycisphaeraceae bacterium]|nr:FHA domain-containing protein [Phycisphaeraceae bacterium]
MSTISVQIITGPGSTRREAFTDPVISFGRDASNAIVLSEPTASRKHGELRYAQGQWVLVNLSPNGTRVNGRSVTRKAQPLMDKDMVAVGDHPVFQVLFDPAPASLVDPVAPTDEPVQSKANRKTKLWIGIGIYLVVMTLAVIVAKDLLDDPADKNGTSVPRLSAEQIRDAVCKPMTVTTPNIGDASRYLSDAKEYYNKLDTDDRNLYAAYRAYQLALANMEKKDFEGIDQLQFAAVQSKLVEEVTTAYNRAYDLLKKPDYVGADAAFFKVIQIFPDANSEVYQNASRQRAVAAGHRKSS